MSWRNHDLNTTLRRTASGRLLGFGESAAGHSPGVVLETTPLVPAAADVFTPEELAARLDYYAERAARRVPLDRDGPPAPPDEPGAVCAGCGTPSPNGNRVGIGRSCWWVLVPKTGDVYCPVCATDLGGRNR